MPQSSPFSFSGRPNSFQISSHFRSFVVVALFLLVHGMKSNHTANPSERTAPTYTKQNVVISIIWWFWAGELVVRWTWWISMKQLCRFFARRGSYWPFCETYKSNMPRLIFISSYPFLHRTTIRIYQKCAPFSHNQLLMPAILLIMKQTWNPANKRYMRPNNVFMLCRD